MDWPIYMNLILSVLYCMMKLSSVKINKIDENVHVVSHNTVEIASEGRHDVRLKGKKEKRQRDAHQNEVSLKKVVDGNGNQPGVGSNKQKCKKLRSHEYYRKDIENGVFFERCQVFTNRYIQLIGSFHFGGKKHKKYAQQENLDQKICKKFTQMEMSGLKNDLIGPKEMLVLGHRGFGQKTFSKRRSFCENTLPSIQRALELVDGVEVDVQVLADGQLVLFHDFLVNFRGNSVFLFEITFEEFIETQNHELSIFKDLRPEHFLLKTVLEEIDPQKIINIELKYPCEKYLSEFAKEGREFLQDRLEYVTAVHDIVQNARNRIYYSSFDLKTVLIMKEIVKNIPIYFLKDLKQISRPDTTSYKMEKYKSERERNENEPYPAQTITYSSLHKHSDTPPNDNCSLFDQELVQIKESELTGIVINFDYINDLSLFDDLQNQDLKVMLYGNRLNEKMWKLNVHAIIVDDVNKYAK